MSQFLQRRSTRRPLAEAALSSEIVERHYQHRGIRRITEAFERDHDRKVALVNQAVNAFRRHLPDASPVNLVTEKEADELMRTFDAVRATALAA